MCIKKKLKEKYVKKVNLREKKKKDKNKINIIVILRGFASLSKRYEKYLLLKLETKKREREKEVTERNREAECA